MTHLQNAIAARKAAAAVTIIAAKTAVNHPTAGTAASLAAVTTTTSPKTNALTARSTVQGYVVLMMPTNASTTKPTKGTGHCKCAERLEWCSRNVTNFPKSSEDTAIVKENRGQNDGAWIRMVTDG